MMQHCLYWRMQHFGRDVLGVDLMNLNVIVYGQYSCFESTCLISNRTRAFYLFAILV